MWLLSVLAIILVFGLIVFVHELGHMLAAKSCGVAVPDFSIGMGKSLMSVKYRGTRYHLSLLPLGGYARIAGMEEDMADAPGAPEVEEEYETRQTWRGINGWQKAWILVAGALMNFVLAFVLMLAMGLIGFPERAVLIAALEPGSPAEQAGIEAGDKVVSIAGETVTNSQQFIGLIQENTKQLSDNPEIRAARYSPIPITVSRTEPGGTEQEFEYLVAPTVLYHQTPEGESVPYNDGKPSIGVQSTDQEFLTAEVSLVQPKTVGYNVEAYVPLPETGLRPGDKLISINDQPVADTDVLSGLLAEHPNARRKLEVSRSGRELAFILPADIAEEELGLNLLPDTDGSVKVATVAEDGLATALTGYVPAGTKGLKLGDTAIALNGNPVDDGLDVLLSLPAFNADGEPVSFKPVKDEQGEVVDVIHQPLTPETGSTNVLAVERASEQLYFLLPWDTTGLSLGIAFQPQLKRLPPLQSLQRSMEDAWLMMLSFVSNFRLLFTEMGAKTVAGPVGIVTLIGQSAQSGWYTFLLIVILINLNLGVLNLLPVPALDGGRLVFVALAGIGLKVPPRREAMIHVVGMIMLLGLIGLVTISDVWALFSR